MELRLFLVLCFQIMMSGSDGAVTVSPLKKSVLVGTPRVVLSCTSDQGFETIRWSYGPVWRPYAGSITTGLRVHDTDYPFYNVERSGSNSINLIIKSATSRRAGIYFCDSSGSSAQVLLVVIESDPECNMRPSAPTELLYSQTVTMSCSITYTALTKFVMANMIWSTDKTANISASRPQTTKAADLTTTVSTLTLIPGNFTPFPIYRCNVSFKANEYSSDVDSVPDYSMSRSFFRSPINVIYLKPANENSITGARTGDSIYLGTIVTCAVEGNPPPSYSWLDVTSGKTSNSSTIQILHSGEYRCSAWNRAARTSISINVITYGGSSARLSSASVSSASASSAGVSSARDSSASNIGIGVGIGLGALLVSDWIGLGLL